MLGTNRKTLGNREMITLEKYELKYEDDFVDFIKDFQNNGNEFEMLSIIEDILIHINKNNFK